MKNYRSYLTIIVLVILGINCKKKKGDMFILKEVKVSNIGVTDADCLLECPEGIGTRGRVGLLWSTDSTFHTELSSYFDESFTANTKANITISLSSLKSNTRYFVKPFVQSKRAVFFGPVTSFNTLAKLIPVVTTDTPVVINAHTALVGGKIKGALASSVVANGLRIGFSNVITKNSIWVYVSTKSISFATQMSSFFADRQYYVQAYAKIGNDTFYGQVLSFKTPVSSTLAIGDYYGGGIIFYLDGTGQHGLIVNKVSSGSRTWGCSGTSIGSTSTLFDKGLTNTSAIVAKCSSTSAAASICYNLVENGYSDWFLPSRTEVTTLNNNLISKGAIEFNVPITIWTSSEANSTTAYSVNINSSYTATNQVSAKSGSVTVWAIRKF